MLMKDAVQPTLLQTLEATPVMVHAGPCETLLSPSHGLLPLLIAWQTHLSSTAMLPALVRAEHFAVLVGAACNSSGTAQHHQGGCSVIGADC